MWYDLLTLCILMFAMFRGAMKGIVWQLATIAALGMCFFFSGSLSSIVAPFIRVEPPLDHWIAMFVLYLGFSFVSFGFARVLHEWIEQMKIEALDRHLGAILGLVKGGMFSVFLTFFLVTLSHGARDSIINSESGYAAAVIIDHLDPVLPGHLHALLEPYIQRLDGPEIERRHDDERYARDGDRPDRRDPLDRGEPFARDPVESRRDREESRPLDRERPGNFQRDSDRELARERPGDLDRDRIRERDRDRDKPRERPAGGDPFDGTDPDRDVSRRESRHRDERDYRPAAADPRDDDLSRDEAATSWLSSLPAIGAEIRQLALKAWRNTRPEHRGELRRRVAGSVPDLVRKTLQDWENGRPSPAASNDERAELERDIVHELADDETGSYRVIDDIEAALRGIPDDVSLDVLRDWRADLRSDKIDPDPQTTTRMGLNERIRRQLARAGISIRTLDTATQDRLRRSDVR